VQTKRRKIILKASDNCGTGAGGFKPGNDCAGGDGGGGDKPKGAPGEDKEKQQAQAKTPEFKEWFGDSKVVDDDGEPAVVYHQTTEDFDEFDVDQTSMGVFWFTSSEDEARRGETGASRRADQEIKVKEVYLSIQNMANRDQYERLSLGQIEGDGYDGIYLEDTGTYIVFNSNQIKSSTGNTGDFSRDSDNINKSYRIALKAGSDCGTGAGGFQSGNTCATGEGAAGTQTTGKPKEPLSSLDAETRKKITKRAKALGKRDSKTLTTEQRDELQDILSTVDNPDDAAHILEIADALGEASSESLFATKSLQRNTKRIVSHNQEVKTTIASLDKKGIKANSAAFELPTDREKVEQQFEEWDQKERVYADTNRFSELDHQSKQVKVAAQEVSREMIEELHPILDGISMDSTPREIKKARDAVQEKLTSMRRHLLDKDINISLDESDKSIAKQVVREYTNPGPLEEPYTTEFHHETTRDIIATGVAEYIAIDQSHNLIRDHFEKSGQESPDLRGISFKVSNGEARSKTGQSLRGVVKGYYDSDDKSITLDTETIPANALGTFFTGGSGEHSNLGVVVHEIGHALHHRKLGGEHLLDGIQRRTLNLISAGSSEPEDMLRILDTDSEIGMPFGDYAKVGVQEVVAEGFAMKVLQPDKWKGIDKKARRAYEAFGGP